MPIIKGGLHNWPDWYVSHKGCSAKLGPRLRDSIINVYHEVFHDTFNITKTIFALTGLVLISGCVIDESYATDYDNTTTYYSPDTTGYNRNYHKRHHKSHQDYPTGKPTPGSHYSQTVVETVGTPQPSPGYPSGSYPSGSYPSGSYPTSTPTPGTSSQTVVETVG